jgi:hypothetical protein
MNRPQRRKSRKAMMSGYLHRLLAAAPDLAAVPGVSNCVVEHDNTCAIFQRGLCDCTPDIAITTMTGGSVLVIDEQGAASKVLKQ